MLYPDLPPEFWLSQSSTWTALMRQEALGTPDPELTEARPEVRPETRPEAQSEPESKSDWIAVGLSATLLFICLTTLAFSAVTLTIGATKLQHQQNSLLLQRIPTWSDLR